MSPASNSSSMEPHNGSAYSNGGRSPRTNASSSHRRVATAHRPRRGPLPARPRNHVNGGGVDYMEPHDNEEMYDSAFTYAISPHEQSVRRPSDAYYHESHYYYSSAQFHTNETTTYDNELKLDEEQFTTAAAQTQQYTVYPTGDYCSQQAPTSGQEYACPQTPVQNYNSHQNIHTLSTTQVWSTQPHSEERLRLGLPRYATEEEVQAARCAYEAATHQVDHSEPAPHMS